MLWITLGYGLLVVLALYLYSRSELLNRDLDLCRRQLKQSLGNHTAEQQFNLCLTKELQQLALYQLKRQPETEESQWRLLLVEKLLDVCSESQLRKQKPSQLFVRHEQRNLNTVPLERWPRFVSRQSEEFQQCWRQDSAEGFIQCCRLLAQTPAAAKSLQTGRVELT